MLVALSKSKQKAFITSNLNKNHNILFESYEDGYVSGLTENYIKVHALGNKNLLNNIYPVKLNKYSNEVVLGDLIHWKQTISSESVI